MTLDRRDFLKGIAAGFAVATMPAALSIAARTQAATEIIGAPGWSFAVIGGSGPIGDGMILMPPGWRFDAKLDMENLLAWPAPLDIDKLADNGGAIRLIPWRPYLKQFEHLMTAEIRDAFEQARKWTGGLRYEMQDHHLGKGR